MALLTVCLLVTVFMLDNSLLALVVRQRRNDATATIDHSTGNISSWSDSLVSKLLGQTKSWYIYYNVTGSGMDKNTDNKLLIKTKLHHCIPL